jgi:cytochrome b
MPPEPSLRPVRVWDLPTRLFHWSLALAVFGLLVTGQVGGNAMVWHIRLGLAVMALLLFRLVWGTVGGHWSRFVSFLYGPRDVIAYLRGDGDAAGRFGVGHNPVGALSVYAMLGLLALQVSTGLLADDEIATTGPLNRFVTSAVANAASAWHAGAGKTLLIVLVMAHLGAVLYYLWRRRTNLITPMIRGDRLLGVPAPASVDDTRARLTALGVLAAAAVLAWWVGRLGDSGHAGVARRHARHLPRVRSQPGC